MCLKENTGNIFKGFVQVHWLSARLTERPIFSYLKNLAEKNRSKIDRISKNPWQFNRFLELCRQTVEGIKNIVFKDSLSYHRIWAASESKLH